MNFYFKIIPIILLVNSINLAAQNTILWSVQDSASQKKSFLLGTFHQMGNSFIDSIPQIKELLLKSDIAIFESIDNSKKLIATLNNRPEDNSYKKYLDNNDIDFLLEVAKNWEVPLNKLTPVELLIKLDQEYVVKNCGTVKRNDKWKHFEKYLISIAQEKNHKILGLENDSIQTKDINDSGKNLTWNDAKKYIHKSVNDILKSKNKKDICYNAQQYMKFNNDYQFTEKCGDSSLLQRNNLWLQKLIPNLETKNVFIAVGLLHLYGDCGLIMQLRKLGYTVNPIELK